MPIVLLIINRSYFLQWYYSKIILFKLYLSWPEFSENKAKSNSTDEGA